jgi:hypothetical protein
VQDINLCWVQDIKLIWSNCDFYNQTGPIRVLGQNMAAKFEAMWSASGLGLPQTRAKPPPAGLQTSTPSKYEPAAHQTTTTPPAKVNPGAKVLPCNYPATTLQLPCKAFPGVRVGDVLGGGDHQLEVESFLPGASGRMDDALKSQTVHLPGHPVAELAVSGQYFPDDLEHNQEQQEANSSSQFLRASFARPNST